MKRLSRQRIIVYLLLIFIVVIGFFFRRDLRLSLTADLNIPDIVAENIEIKRVIGGDEWHLLSTRAEHKRGVIYGQSLDITVTSSSGDVSRMFAGNGVFSRISSDITVETLSADILREGKNILMKAGRAHYDSVTDMWYFSDDITINDGSIEASGPEGLYDVKHGQSTITGGGTVKWQES